MIEKKCTFKVSIIISVIKRLNANQYEKGVVGWCEGPVLGKLPVPGRPTICMIVGQGPIALAVGGGGGCLDIFTLLYLFSSLSPSIWESV